MQKFILYVVVFFTTASFYSQMLPSNPEYYKNQGAEIKLEDFRGSKYLSERFEASIVKDELTGKNVNKYIRYDALNDFFEMKDQLNSSTLSFLKKEAGINLKYGQKTFVFTNYVNKKGKREMGYLHSLGALNETNIYVKYGRRLKMPEKAKSSLETDKKGIIIDTMYYVSETGNSKKADDINKKSILNFFDAKQKQKVKDFIKSNRLKFKKVADFEQLIKFNKTLE